MDKTGDRERWTRHETERDGQDRRQREMDKTGDRERWTRQKTERDGKVRRQREMDKTGDRERWTRLETERDGEDRRQRDGQDRRQREMDKTGDRERWTRQETERDGQDWRQREMDKTGDRERFRKDLSPSYFLTLRRMSYLSVHTHTRTEQKNWVLFWHIYRLSVEIPLRKQLLVKLTIEDSSRHRLESLPQSEKCPSLCVSDSP
ncbi:hypothetical protein BgiBS90_027541 [Biomphalaria glabrata]|nr:hypothetical protein BgiBS90_027541 [Biomphalaria glabrata]